MAFSESLADRIRHAFRQRPEIHEKKMFGGVGFLLRGNMLVGIWKQSLVVRLGPEQAEAALEQPFVKEFDITGRPMKGWVMVEPDGIDLDEQLTDWIRKAEKFVGRLPAK
jgi:TfoX/Sxy family transcriptional regulator of competence genes